jgi:hypothetical protein
MPPSTEIEPQASLDDIMEVYYTFVRLADPDFDEKAMKAMLVNLRRDNDDNEAIFDESTMAFHDFGCPMAVYNEVYMQCDNGVAEAKNSAKKKKKAAAVMLTNANAEYTDKLRCADFETRMQESDLQRASITTAAAIPVILGGCSPYSGLSVGEYVDVSADLMVEKCSHGGMAYIIARSGPGSNATYTVLFRKGVERSGTIEEHIRDKCANFSANSDATAFWKAERSREKLPPVASRQP